MPIELKMPALSPTMEEGTLAKWLVKEGDKVVSGDILAEIETDKATMEFEAVDEGTIAKILVAEGTDGVKVGAPIAILAGEGEDASKIAARAEARRGDVCSAEGRVRAQSRRDSQSRSAAADAGRNAGRPAAARRRAARRGRTDQGVAARETACPGPGHRPLIHPGHRPGRADRPRRPRQSRRWRSRSARRRRGSADSHAPRHARAVSSGNPARGRQALQHPQDHRAPPDRVEAAGPAHLSDGRHPARRAAQAPLASSTRASRAATSSSASTT